MTYRDQLLTCAECGKRFVYRVEEQRSQERLGFEPETPEKCANCRGEKLSGSRLPAGKPKPPKASPPAPKTVTLGPGLHAGEVKWYREDKHFGFITLQDGNDVFFHRSGVAGDQEHVLQEGAPVWFEVTMTDRGPQAVNVHLRE